MKSYEAKELQKKLELYKKYKENINILSDAKIRLREQISANASETRGLKYITISRTLPEYDKRRNTVNVDLAGVVKDYEIADALVIIIERKMAELINLVEEL